MAVNARRLLSIVVLLVIAATSSAFAGELTRKDRKKVVALLKEAQKAEKMGERFVKRAKTRKRGMARYKVAARAFLDAYELSEEPALVFRLASIYEARGEKRWALRGYQRYLELDPTGRNQDAANERIEALSGDVSSSEPDGDSDIDPSELFGEEEVEEPPAEEEPAQEEETEPVAVRTPKPVAKSGAKPDPGRTLRYAGIGTAVAGALAVGLGVKFGLDASSASDELSNKEGAWTDADRRLIADGEQAETRFLIFSMVGAVGIVGGGVLYYMGAKRKGASKEKQSARVTPIVTADGMSISWMGTF
tara:strand:+ start:5673 stop:6590 length:918 start_codon:yes stop_codon:yes gene_type:complete